MRYIPKTLRYRELKLEPLLRPSLDSQGSGLQKIEIITNSPQNMNRQFDPMSELFLKKEEP